MVSSLCLIISIHAPAKGATRGIPRQAVGGDISIHAPEKGATISAPFSPATNSISIHAPEKGATHRQKSIRRQCIFQSTLPRRERPRTMSSTETTPHFNPRSREGSDTFQTPPSVEFRISIHAPEKGATIAPAAISPMPNDFNPRSREGSDPSSVHDFHQGVRISIHAPEKGATLQPVVWTAAG